MAQVKAMVEAVEMVPGGAMVVVRGGAALVAT